MTKVSFHKSEMDGNKYTVEGITRLAFTIKASMKLRGWSERKLASHAGVSHVTVNKYVRANIHEPQSDILKALAPYIYKVSSIDQDRIEIFSDETYDQDWQSLEKIATAEFSKIFFDSDKANEMAVAETPTRYKSKNSS
jgi:transcriptional regulator with XRE-family HTH domain